MPELTPGAPGPDESGDPGGDAADWHRRVVGRSLKTATARSIDRGSSLIRAAAALLERSNGDGFTVQDVADEAGQSLRTLYQYFESKDDLLLAVFEEAMRTYAVLVREAIADLGEPLDRLGGGVLAALRMPESSEQGVDRGLARLRMKLGEVSPEMVARSQAAFTAVVQELVEDAAGAGAIHPIDPEGATYLVVALESAWITSHTLGNDFGVRLPSALDVAGFLLGGLGARVDREWLEATDSRLRMPGRPLSIVASRGPERSR